MHLNTRELALLAGIQEAELVHALQTDGYLYGIEVPEPVKRSGKTRIFDYSKALIFANRVKSERKISGQHYPENASCTIVNCGK